MSENSGSSTVRIVGVVNTSPDSFYDGGRYASLEAGLEHGLRLVHEGADWLDVGGESTRPGAEAVSEAEECQRVLPLMEALAKHTEVCLSVDTRRSTVAKAALERGATAINAVAGLRDSRLAALAAEFEAVLVINHMRGEPRTMQENPNYVDVVREVREELVAQAIRAESLGVARERIWLDPGLGFGKHPLHHNLPLIARLSDLVAARYPVMVGPSRKSFIGVLTGAAPSERLPGSLAALTACVLNGAAAVRVHDVAAARQAALVATALRECAP